MAVYVFTTAGKIKLATDPLATGEAVKRWAEEGMTSWVDGPLPSGYTSAKPTRKGGKAGARLIETDDAA